MKRCSQCEDEITLDVGNVLSIYDGSVERFFCSHLCAIEALVADIWNALLATQRDLK